MSLINRLRFLSCALFLVLYTAPVAAQLVTGTITGNVIDSTRSTIPGASVTLENQQTGETRSAVSSDTGNFVFTAVPPGTYRVTIEIPGFKRYEQSGIVLSANERLPLGSIVLEVGELSDSVTVSAEGAAVQSESSELSAQLTSTQMESMAIRGRDVVAFLRILPGVAYGSDVESPGGNFGTASTSINGTRATGNIFFLDGVPGMDMSASGTFSSTISFDAVSEVKVLTNSYRAEHGSNGGAVVDVVTKGGTRDFHGSAYWYKRHENLNANDFFRNQAGVQKPLYRYSTLGGSIGGPILLPGGFNANRDKLFFFYSIENWLSRVPRPLQQVTMPTALERAGDFSQSLDLNGQVIPVIDPVTGEPFPGNVIPAERINPNGTRLLNVFPLPNFTDRSVTGGTYNYVFSDSGDNPKRNHNIRIDFHPTDRDSITWRGTSHWQDNRGFTSIPVGMPGWGLLRHHYENNDDGMVVNYTRTINPAIINQLSVSARKSTEAGPIFEDAGFERLQRQNMGLTLSQWNPEINYLDLMPMMTFGGITGAASATWDTRFPVLGRDNIYTITNSLSWVHRDHIFKFGVYLYQGDVVEGGIGGQGNFAGRFDFGRDVNNPLDTRHPYANALLGHFRSYTESTSLPRQDGRSHTVEWYAQDSWKATPHFTVDYGMRFMWYNQRWQRDGNAAVLALDRYDSAQAPSLYEPGFDSEGRRVGVDPLTGEIVPAVQIGSFVPGSGDPVNGMVVATDPTYPRGFQEQEPIQLMPRVGFAYDVGGRGMTAIRAGAGVTKVGRETGNAKWLHIENPPIQFNPVLYYGTFDTFLDAEGVLFPSRIVTSERDARTPTTYNWNLSIQQDVGFGTVAEIAYVGNSATHLSQRRDLNLVPYGARFLPENQDPTTGTALPDDFFRPYPGHGQILYAERAANANYHGMQLSVNRRYAQNLQFGLAYTWSKAMDVAAVDTSLVATYRPHKVWNYGKASHDQTHKLLLNYTWDIPNLSTRWNTPIVRHVLDNWQISGITAFVSGFPSGIGFSTTDNADITGGGDGARVVVNGKAQLPRGERSPNRWFDTSVFSRPAQGEFGNAPKDVFRLPGVNNWDIALQKKVPLAENTSLNIRWEVYNLFNHTQWSSVDSTARFDPAGNQVNPRFGQVTASRSPRIMQGSLRIEF